MITQADRRKAELEQRVANLRALHPWVSGQVGGDGSLGDVVYRTSCRYRHGVMRDFGDLHIPAGVTIYGHHFLVYRARGPIVVGGHVNLDGGAANPDGSPSGPRAPAAIVRQELGRLVVRCRSCGREHLAVRGSTLADWAPFVYGFGGEIFMCSCGAESELRLDRPTPPLHLREQRPNGGLE